MLFFTRSACKLHERRERERERGEERETETVREKEKERGGGRQTGRALKKRGKE